ncbi:MAG: hypothetical protein LKF99_03805 [Bifidobacterium sp.]|jgi:hypothetical protein|nr:hypothetical protein [Bifidobacterium sp.]
MTQENFSVIDHFKRLSDSTPNRPGDSGRKSHHCHGIWNISRMPQSFFFADSGANDRRVSFPVVRTEQLPRINISSRERLADMSPAPRSESLRITQHTCDLLIGPDLNRQHHSPRTSVTKF